MRALMKFLIWIWAIWLPTTTAIYFFSNGSIGEVKSVSVEDLYIKMARIDDIKGEDKDNQEVRVAVAKAYLKRVEQKGSDISNSFYGIISKNKDFSGIVTKIENTVSAIDTNIDIVTLKFDYENLNYSINFLVKDKEFAKPLAAEIVLIDSIVIVYREPDGTSKKVLDTRNDFPLSLFLMANLANSSHRSDCSRGWQKGLR
jgi:hypothetical protein